MRSSDRSVSSITSRAAAAPERCPRLVVRRGRAAQREAAVSAARPAGDLACLVEPHANAALRQCERARAAGDAAPDDGHLGAPFEARAPKRLSRLVEPIGRRRHERRSYVHPVERPCLKHRPAVADMSNVTFKAVAGLGSIVCLLIGMTLMLKLGSSDAKQSTLTPTEGAIAAMQNTQTAMPAIQSYLAAHGSYIGMTVPALQAAGGGVALPPGFQSDGRRRPGTASRTRPPAAPHISSARAAHPQSARAPRLSSQTAL